MICILLCVPATQSQIIFCHHIFGPLYPLLIPWPLSLWKPPYCFLCLCISMEASLRRHNWLNHLPLVINSTSNPSPYLEVWGGGLQVLAFYHMIDFPDNQPLSLSYLRAFQKSLHLYKLRCGWKELAMNNKRHPFHFCCSGPISGIGNKIKYYNRSMNLETIMLNEINCMEKVKNHMISVFGGL